MTSTNLPRETSPSRFDGPASGGALDASSRAASAARGTPSAGFAAGDGNSNDNTATTAKDGAPQLGLRGAGGDSLDGNEVDTNWDQTVDSFDELELREDLLRGIYAYGFEKPSAIQQRGILPVLKGHDTIAQAQSGTGKTATFAISVLQAVDTSLRETQALILAPTMELANQIQKVMLALGDYMNVSVKACVDGTNNTEDIRDLQSGVHVVVGTPCRVYDMINRRALRLDNVGMFVLDEADEMLSRGFKDQIYDVFKFLPEKVQVCLFSATMPMDCLEITQRFMRDPIRILVKRDELTLEGI